MSKYFLAILVAFSFLIAATGSSMAIDYAMADSEMPMISNTMDCPACVPIAHGAGNSVCVQLPCFKLAEASEVVANPLVYNMVYAVGIVQLPEGLTSKPPTPPV